MLPARTAAQRQLHSSVGAGRACLAAALTPHHAHWHCHRLLVPVGSARHLMRQGVSNRCSCGSTGASGACIPPSPSPHTQPMIGGSSSSPGG